jgi:hypothetical protein
MARTAKISPSINKYVKFDGEGCRVTKPVPGQILYKTGVLHGKLGIDSNPVYSILINEFGGRKHFFRKERNASLERMRKEILELRAQVKNAEIQLAPSNAPLKPESTRPDLSTIDEVTPLNPRSFENQSPSGDPGYQDLTQAKEVLYEWRQREKKVKELLAEQVLWDLNYSNYNAYVIKQQELTISLQEKNAALEKADGQLSVEAEKWNRISGGTFAIFQVLWDQYRSGWLEGNRRAALKLSRKSKRQNVDAAQSPSNQTPPANQLDMVFEL